jgi:hypothetical protein
MASLYTRAADRRRLAIEAMHKLERRGNTKKDGAANRDRQTKKPRHCGAGVKVGF